MTSVNGFTSPHAGSATALQTVPHQPHRPIRPSAPPSAFPSFSFPATATPTTPSPLSHPPPQPIMPTHLAHKSAHHLHSIPPREKSTRTLILDHMLWQLTRARFAQARAELGMRKIPGPEEAEYDRGGDDDDDASDGEAVDVLAYRTGGRLGSGAILGGGDPGRARAYRSVADGHERVLAAMLEQPPEPSFNGADGSPERLPNGVRLRLALASLTNELFSRDWDGVASDGEAFKEGGKGGYPPSITTLMLISAPGTPQPPPPTLPSFADLISSASPAPAAAASGSSSPSTSTKPSIWAAVPRGLGPDAPWAFAGSLSPSTSGSPQPPTANSPSLWPRLNIDSSTKPTRAQQLYNAGATGGAGRETQCVRHLAACNCSTGVVRPGHPGGSSSTTTTGRHIGAGLRRPASLLVRKPSALSLQESAMTLPTARLTDLLPRFLRLSALVAIELGREAAAGGASSTLSEADSSYASASRNETADTTPEPSDVESSVAPSTTPRPPPPARPSRAWYALLASLCTRAILEGYIARGWRTLDGLDTLFGLGVGLGESEAWAALPMLGGGGGAGDESDDEDGAELEPDGYPGIEEAARILFPFSSAGPGTPKGGAAAAAEGSGTGKEKEREREEIGVWERLVAGAGRQEQEEFEAEMKERHSVFFNVPNGVELRAHLIELAQRYPPEPMERAALRFCEAVSSWRGNPGLQGKKSHKAQRPRGMSTTSTHSTISITSLIHPPTPRGPPIESWFVLPTKHERRAAAVAGKRKREGGGEGRRKGPRAGAEDGGQGRRGWVEAEEWIGPYGIPYGQ